MSHPLVVCLGLATALVACSGPDPSTAPGGDDPIEGVLSGPDQQLPLGFVGRRYDASPEVSGGEPPYRWALASGEVTPGGLVLQPNGQISGTPTEAGDHTFAVVATDSEGRTKRVLLSLEIRLDPLILQCGDTASGLFYYSAMDITEPNLNDLDNIAWLAIDVPRDDTQRIELVFDNQVITTAYVERPAELPGSWNIEDHYVPFYLNPGFSDPIIRLDPGTTPSLSGYESQAWIPVLLASQGVGGWQLEVVCTDGPVVEQLLQYPTELGQPIEIDYDVWGPDEGVRIFTEDPLPDWVEWDEETGQLSGTAMEAGAWEFSVITETEDGRRREEPSILGVYAVEEIACGQTAPVEVEEGYYDGAFYAYWDPRGYRVYHLDLSGLSPSAINLQLSGSDGHYLGIAEPDPGWLKFYGVEREYTGPYTATLQADPHTYPTVGHYLDDDQMYIVAGTTASIPSMQLSVACDTAPRLDLPDLPVAEPLVPLDEALPVIGGEAPYTWSATGLPPGLSVDTGRLQGTTGSVGTFAVQLTVEDKLGVSTTEAYTLYAGLDEACAGATRVSCGDSTDGAFTTSYYTDDSGPGSTAVFCLVNTEDRSLGWEIYADDGELRVDVGDPGGNVYDLLHTEAYTYMAYVTRASSEGIAISPWSWPDLDDYPRLPIFLSVRAYDPGTWTAHLICE
ncbi:MAG TPA: hypothetical protein ENK18_27915 [Deltaproteobacteria bacterium]|nr:hypothetical protein [Deltaproteobacteria bacterium]